ncbi:MAG: fumarylacetoacetase [Fimbriimonadaceae bacterium]|jgi:fumarylacetoacetase|nr:fumarylacetoacetase [Fimbriimonadaceae bacterium]
MKRFVIPREATSWVPVPADSHFPIQNLPFGLASPKGRNEAVVVAIGDFALDLLVLSEVGMLSEEDFPILDSFIELEGEALPALRRRVFEILSAENSELRDSKKLREKALIPLDKANLQVPIPPNAFVDFYSGIHHASNVGKMFRPDQPPLLPNYRHVPIAYNGRASSVVASGTPIIRPKGQTKGPNDENPTWGPTQELDFELEMGFYLAEGSEMGKRITTRAAEDHILGLVIVNDWSARDVQRWEYQPLGPFLAKTFATTVSPWIVTLDALEPFRIEGMEQDPPALPYLRQPERPHFDVQLEVWLQTPKMNKSEKIATSNMKHMYWSLSQQLAHLTSNGTPVEFGDLTASGTISGPEPHEAGSLLELSRRGTRPITLSETGETRTFLQDGDTLILTAYAEQDGLKIGFGECKGVVKPALD